MTVVGIVPAGGSGERLGADRPKAFVVCAGRPLIEWSLEVLDSVCDRGAIAAVPMTDTVKEVATDGRVLKTLDRSTLWAIQTPQAFRADILRRALERDAAALAAATDDAWLVDDAGGVITVVESFPENIKVTRESDLHIAEALLAH